MPTPLADVLKEDFLCSSMSLMFLTLKLWKLPYDFEPSHHMSGVFFLKSFRMQIVLSIRVQMVVKVYIQFVIRTILSSVSGPCSQKSFHKQQIMKKVVITSSQSKRLRRQLSWFVQTMIFNLQRHKPENVKSNKNLIVSVWNKMRRML